MLRRFPVRGSTHVLEELSERHFQQALPEDWTWEKVSPDYGADLRVEIFEQGQATGLEFLVQLKSAENGSGDNDELIRLKTSTYNYLWDRLQVVMLVKFVNAEKEAYWLLLREVAEPNQQSKSLTIRIPKTRALSRIDWDSVKDVVREVTSGKLKSSRERRTSLEPLNATISGREQQSFQAEPASRAIRESKRQAVLSRAVAEIAAHRAKHRQFLDSYLLPAVFGAGADEFETAEDVNWVCDQIASQHPHPFWPFNEPPWQIHPMDRLEFLKQMRLSGRRIERVVNACDFYTTAWAKRPVLPTLPVHTALDVLERLIADGEAMQLRLRRTETSVPSTEEIEIWVRQLVDVAGACATPTERSKLRRGASNIEVGENIDDLWDSPKEHWDRIETVFGTLKIARMIVQRLTTDTP